MQDRYREIYEEQAMDGGVVIGGANSKSLCLDRKTGLPIRKTRVPIATYQKLNPQPYHMYVSNIYERGIANGQIQKGIAGYRQARDYVSGNYEDYAKWLRKYYPDHFNRVGKRAVQKLKGANPTRLDAIMANEWERFGSEPRKAKKVSYYQISPEIDIQTKVPQTKVPKSTSSKLGTVSSLAPVKGL